MPVNTDSATGKQRRKRAPSPPRSPGSTRSAKRPTAAERRSIADDWAPGVDDAEVTRGAPADADTPMLAFARRVHTHTHLWVLEQWRGWFMAALRNEHPQEHLRLALAVLHQRFALLRDDSRALDYLRACAPRIGDTVDLHNQINTDWPNETRRNRQARADALRAAAFWSPEFALTGERPLRVQRIRLDLGAIVETAASDGD